MIKKLPLFVCFLLYFGGFAQELALCENDWFLTAFTQNGEEISIPDNEEVSAVPLNFNVYETDSIPNFRTHVCNYFSSELEFTGNGTTFTLLFPTSSLVVCYDLENEEFELAYFDFFKQEGAFSYSLSEDNNAKTLIINSPNGNDSATYTSTNLSASYTEQNRLRLYPNPATHTLYINSEEFKAQELHIYDLNGKKITDFEVYDHTIDISRLSNGLYFLSISSGKQQEILKFIKN
jgi:hypothetical protein